MQQFRGFTFTEDKCSLYNMTLGGANASQSLKKILILNVKEEESDFWVDMAAC